VLPTTTYSAGTGLKLSSGTFSIANGGVGSTQIADGSITASDLGFVRSVPLNAGSLAGTTCIGTTEFITDGPGTEGDFTMTTTEPALQLGLISQARVGPIIGGFRTYNYMVCNTYSFPINVPAGTIKMLVVSQ